MTSGRDHVLPVDLLLFSACLGPEVRAALDLAAPQRAALDAALDVPPELHPTLDDAVEARRRALDEATRAVSRISVELDEVRERSGAAVDGSPWFAEPPQIVLAQLVDVRRQIARVRDALDRRRARVANFDWMGWALGEVAAGPEVPGVAPVFWLVPGRVPVMHTGLPARRMDPDWFEDARIPVIEVDAARLFELVAGGGSYEHDDYVVREAFELLLRALREAGVQRLPP